MLEFCPAAAARFSKSASNKWVWNCELSLFSTIWEAKMSPCTLDFLSASAETWPQSFAVSPGVSKACLCVSVRQGSTAVSAEQGMWVLESWTWQCICVGHSVSWWHCTGSELILQLKVVPSRKKKRYCRKRCVAIDFQTDWNFRDVSAADRHSNILYTRWIDWFLASWTDNRASWP